MEVDGDFGIGLGACAIASLFFGSMWVPVKAYPLGDGVFVQWLMAAAIWLVGLVVQAIQGFPEFYAWPLLGGSLWALGNVLCVPVVSEIGMGLGLLLWGFTNLLFGWLSGRFGWFGLRPQVPASDLLNGLGLALAFISTIMFALVDTPTTPPVISSDEDDVPLLPKGGGLSHRYRRIAAIVAALIAGTFMGFSFAPVIYIEDNYVGASRNGLDYVFSFYSGIFATASVLLILYTLFRRNRPYAQSQTILPGLISGAMWGIAEAGWFVANDKLSEAISFPLITRFPGVIGALWGVFVFKEIAGKRNLWLLSIAILVTVIGGVLSGLSKVITV